MRGGIHMTHPNIIQRRNASDCFATIDELGSFTKMQATVWINKYTNTPAKLLFV